MSVYFITAVAALFTASSCSSLYSNAGNSTESHSVMMGSTTVPLLFEGPTVRGALKERIAADLQLNMPVSEEPSFKEISESHLRPDAPGQKYERIATHFLDNRLAKDPPDILKDYFGKAVKLDGQYHLLVHKKVVAEYRRKIDLLDHYPDALGKLQQFLLLLQDPVRLKQTVTAPESLFFSHEVEISPELAKKTFRELVDEHPVHVRPASLLDFARLGDVTKDPEDDDILVALTLITWSRDDDTFVSKFPPFAYVDGKWHILVVRLP